MSNSQGDARAEYVEHPTEVARRALIAAAEMPLARSTPRTFVVWSGGCFSLAQLERDAEPAPGCKIRHRYSRAIVDLGRMYQEGGE